MSTKRSPTLIGLIRMHDNYRRWWTEAKAELAIEKRRTAALRGVIGRMKREAEGGENGE